MTNKISPLKIYSDYISIEIYGKSGSGKTTFAGTAPKPILILDVVDHGLLSLVNEENIFVSVIKSWSDLENIYTFLTKNPDKFKTVVIDTVTQLQNILLDELTGGNENMRIKIWSKFASIMGIWLVKFRDLPMNKIFICQDKTISNNEEFDDEIFPLEKGPALTPSVSNILNSISDVIGYTYIRERTSIVRTKGGDREIHKIEYCLKVGPDPHYITKIRGPKDKIYPKVLVNPEFNQILNIIKNGGTL